MDRKRAQQLLPIITAFAEGKAIQARWKLVDDGTINEWADSRSLYMDNFVHAEYRIKPEPREFWVHPNMDAKLNAIAPSCSVYPVDGWIHVREVIE